jgi:uncharacterized protein YrzB (UPF0473 family)
LIKLGAQERLERISTQPGACNHRGIDMKNEAHAQPEEALITLEGEDGKSYSCQLLNIFEFENQEYALLLKADEKKDVQAPPDEEGSLVIMRLIERDDQSIFQTIESDEEFDRVVAHVELLAKQAQAEGMPEE